MLRVVEICGAVVVVICLIGLASEYAGWREGPGRRVSLRGRFKGWLLPPEPPPDEVVVAVAPNVAHAALIEQVLDGAGIECLYPVSDMVASQVGRRAIRVRTADAARAAEVLHAHGYPTEYVP